MKLTVIKVIFGLAFLTVVVGAVWSFVARLYEVGIIAAVLATMFGIFVAHDIHKALKK